MPFFYLSFADPDKPEGSQFLGATVVEADNVMLAVPESHRLGVNPGGEVAIIELEYLTRREDMDADMLRYFRRFVPRDEVFADGAIPLEMLADNDRGSTNLH